VGENLSTEHSIAHRIDFVSLFLRRLELETTLWIKPTTDSPMIDLLLQVGYVLLVLAVLSFFFCTLPVWLIVVVVVLLLR
jgi:hypothetical protein